jgi:hypothetical protein
MYKSCGTLSRYSNHTTRSLTRLVSSNDGGGLWEWGRVLVTIWKYDNLNGKIPLFGVYIEVFRGEKSIINNKQREKITPILASKRAL